MEAPTTETEHGFSKLNTKDGIQSPSAARRGSYTNVLERLNWEDVDLDCFLKKEDKVQSITNKVMRVLPKPIIRGELFKCDIPLSYHVHSKNVCHWSRHLMTEGTGHSPASAAPTPSLPEWEYTARTCQITVHFDKPSIATAKQVCVEGVEKEDDAFAGEELPRSSFPVEEPREEPGETDNQDKTCPTAAQENQDDFENFELQPDETAEVGEKGKEKSVRRRLLGWFNHLIQNHYKRKLTKSYTREEKEGFESYESNFNFIYPMTRAQRERQKRKKWLKRDKRRQSLKENLDAYWENKRQKKQTRRKKEEERFEKWAAEHDLSIPAFTESKRRMSRRQKRLLRAKEFIFQ
ncbi:uncharacterized protein ACNS7B_002212 isoform 1-T1 [Menidia menidia]